MAYGIRPSTWRSMANALCIGLAELIHILWLLKVSFVNELFSLFNIPRISKIRHQDHVTQRNGQKLPSYQYSLWMIHVIHWLLNLPDFLTHLSPVWWGWEKSDSLRLVLSQVTLLLMFYTTFWKGSLFGTSAWNNKLYFLIRHHLKEISLFTSFKSQNIYLISPWPCWSINKAMKRSVMESNSASSKWQ